MGTLKEIMMILTESCNLSCTYCFEQHKSSKYMSFEIAKKIIDFEMTLEDDSDECRFTMFGGEPMLEFALIQKIDTYISENLPYWKKKAVMFIDTNGTLMDEKAKEWLCARKEHIYCGLSLDGTREMHNKNRSDSFDKIDLDFYRECWPKQSVKMTVSKETLPYLAEGVIYIQQMGYSCGCTFAYGIDWSQNMLDVLKEQLELLVEYYTDHPDVELCQMLNIDLTGVFRKKQSNYKRCAAGQYVKSYDTEGNVYPCHTFSPVGLGAEAEKFIGYTLPESDIKETERCVGCPYHFICPTCYGANYIFTGSLSNRSRGLCRFFQMCVQFSAVIQLRRISNKDRGKLDRNDYAILTAIQYIEKHVEAEKQQ